MVAWEEGRRVVAYRDSGKDLVVLALLLLLLLVSMDRYDVAVPVEAGELEGLKVGNLAVHRGEHVPGQAQYGVELLHLGLLLLVRSLVLEVQLVVLQGLERLRQALVLLLQLLDLLLVPVLDHFELLLVVLSQLGLLPHSALETALLLLGFRLEPLRNLLHLLLVLLLKLLQLSGLVRPNLALPALHGALKVFLHGVAHVIVLPPDLL
mmetsp:Transcript_6054/g.18119  ORF Transcript_6054/g.18119 Transcript_6054/m.18119 type:complete len:208 (-) Transcript_6054:494-1117(-)